MSASGSSTVAAWGALQATDNDRVSSIRESIPSGSLFQGLKHFTHSHTFLHAKAHMQTDILFFFSYLNNSLFHHAPMSSNRSCAVGTTPVQAVAADPANNTALCAFNVPLHFCRIVLFPFRHLDVSDISVSILYDMTPR